MGSTDSSSSRRGNPPGFVFQPYDEQLISFFLTNKVLGRDSLVQDIATLDDICKYEPSDLPEFSTLESGVGEWYFFSPPNYKNKNSKQLNRKTRGGNWKVTCKPRKIKSTNGTLIGERTTLVFYQGSISNGKRTSWFLYQYNLISELPNQKKSFFLYKLRRKYDGNVDAPNNESRPSSDLPSAAVEDNANTNANKISLDDLRDLVMPDAELGVLFQMRSDVNQPTHDLATVAVDDDNRIGSGDLGDLNGLGDGQIAHLVSHLRPEMRTIYEENYSSLLSELQPQMQGEQQQASSTSSSSSSSWSTFPLSNDSSDYTFQNHCYSSDINQYSELEPPMQWGQQATSSSWSLPSFNDSQNHCYSADINEEDDISWLIMSLVE